MNVRTLSIISLAMLSLSSVSLAQQDVNQPAGTSVAPTQPPASPMGFQGIRGGRRGFGPGSPQSAVETRIFHLQHAQAGALSRMVVSVFGGMALAVDERTNSLVVSESSERLEQVSRLIQELDVAPRPTSPLSRSMMCRVYMVEAPPEGSELRPFCMNLLLSRGPMTLSAKAMMAAVKDLRIDKIEFNPAGDVVTITGQAASNTTLLDMVTKIPDSILKKLDWDPNGQDNTPLAPTITQAPPLSGQIAENIRSLLGGKTQTVGYWFGNISVPGTISVPIGTWRLGWDAYADQENEMRVSISVEGEPIPGGYNRILSNVIRTGLGKSIVIGYNRESRGARITGAMVILLELDTAQKP